MRNKTSDIKKFSNYTSMRGVEDHIKLAQRELRKLKGKEAAHRAEGLEYALYLLRVMFPDCFEGPTPQFSPELKID